MAGKSKAAATKARPAPRGGQATAKRSPKDPVRIDVPRTSRQVRKGDKPGFRTDMDFIDET